MRSCCICMKKVLRGNGTFFNIPKDEKRRRKWCEICKMDFTPNARICEDHFRSADMIRTGQKKLLMPNAMPIVQPLQQVPFHPLSEE